MEICSAWASSDRLRLPASDRKAEESEQGDHSGDPPEKLLSGHSFSGTFPEFVSDEFVVIEIIVAWKIDAIVGAGRQPFAILLPCSTGSASARIGMDVRSTVGAFERRSGFHGGKARLSQGFRYPIGEFTRTRGRCIPNRDLKNWIFGKRPWAT